MTVKQAATALGLSVQRVRALVKSGLLRASLTQTPIGEYWEIAEAEVDAYKGRRKAAGRPRKED